MMHNSLALLESGVGPLLSGKGHYFIWRGGEGGVKNIQKNCLVRP